MARKQVSLGDRRSLRLQLLLSQLRRLLWLKPRVDTIHPDYRSLPNNSKKRILGQGNLPQEARRNLSATVSKTTWPPQRKLNNAKRNKSRILTGQRRRRRRPLKSRQK